MKHNNKIHLNIQTKKLRIFESSDFQKILKNNIYKEEMYTWWIFWKKYEGIFESIFESIEFFF